MFGYKELIVQQRRYYSDYQNWSLNDQQVQEFIRTAYSYCIDYAKPISG